MQADPTPHGRCESTGPLASFGRWGGPLLATLTSLAMLWWSWRQWPDVLIDFGRELYVAWQLTEGRVLYVDVAYFNGPLSPHVNALWFRLFGVSLMTLVICNLVVTAGLLVGLYRLLLEVSDRLAASTAAVVFATVFAFGQIDAVGNYNYLCPYSHEMTHGLALSIGALWCLSSHLRHRRLRPVAGMGLLVGLVFLTKVELFLAALLAAATGLGLARRLERAAWTRTLTVFAVFAGALLVPPLAALAGLARVMPGRTALDGVLGAWRFVGDPELAALPFYRWTMGTLAPGASLERILSWVVVDAALLVPAFLLGLRFPRARGGGRILVMGVFLAVGVAFGLALLALRVERVVAPLPVFMATLIVASSLRLLRSPGDRPSDAPLTMRVSLGVFALVLLGKVLLNTQIVHYGFALAMPGTLLGVVAIVGMVPALIERRGGHGGVFRAAALAVVAVGVLFVLYTVGLRFDRKHVTVARGADAFIADARGDGVNRALEEIRRRIGPGESLAVLPEGVMLNYLARITSPIPHINFMPPEIIMFGEAAILESLRTRPPDYIALVHKNTQEYGYQFFGRDYGQRIFGWILDNYQGVKVIGALPLVDQRFGILLLRRTRPPQ